MRDTDLYNVLDLLMDITQRTKFRLCKGQERLHIVAALLKAIDRIDEVGALIRASASAAEAQQGLMGLLEIDEIQARAILDTQLRKLAGLERQEIADEYADLTAKISDFADVLVLAERISGAAPKVVAMLSAKGAE